MSSRKAIEMNVGLPGTGIGAIFYIMLVLAMPLRELWVRWAAPGRRRPWRFIAGQVGMAVGMLSVFWVEMQLISSGLHRVAAPHGAMATGNGGHGRVGSFLLDQASRSAIISLSWMIVLLAVVHGAAWLRLRWVRARG